MSSTCGNNCDCADKTQCVKKETSYGIDMVETGKTYLQSSVYAGFNSTLRQGNITHHEYFQVKDVLSLPFVRGVVGSVQRVATAIAPSQLSSHLGPKPLPGSPEALTLARWICRSYRVHTGVDLLQADSQVGDAVLKQLWNHSDAILCCSVKTNVMTSHFVLM